MNLSHFAVARPWSATVLNIAILVIGFFALNRLSVSLFPQVRLPFVSVRVVYPGAQPLLLEQQVAVPMEKQFARISGLNRQISFLRPNGVEFILGFRFGIPEAEALTSIQQAIGRSMGEMPEGVQAPEIRNIDSGQTPVLIYSLAADTSGNGLEALVADLGRGKGIAAVEILGRPKESLHVSLDLEKMHALNVSPLEVFESVQSKLISLPWGNTLGSESIPLRSAQRPLDVVNLRDGRGVEIKDLAILNRVADENAPRVYLGGKKSVSVAVYKRPDGNTPEVVAAASSIIVTWAEAQGINAQKVLDQSEYIVENAREVWIALLWGGAFAILTVVLFLWDGRSGLITGTALPVSVCGTFLGMLALGFSLNMLTLLALSLSIGLLIDDAVVVRESIFKEMERGRKPFDAALIGTRKVFSPVVATTLCIVAVFLPVSFGGGLIGQFFKEFGLTICIAVVLSTWVAFTMDPLLSAYFPSPKRGSATRESSHVGKTNSQLVVFTFLRRASRWLLAAADWSLKRPFVTLVWLTAFFGFSLFLAYRGGVDFLAQEDRGQILVEFLNPAGEPPRHLDELGLRITQATASLPGVKEVMVELAGGADPSRGLARIFLEPKSSRGQPIGTVFSGVRKALASANLDVLVKDPPPIEGVGGEPPLSLYIYGQDLEKMHDEAIKLRDQLAALPGTGSVSVDTQGLSRSQVAVVNEALVVQSRVDINHVHATGRLVLSGLRAGQREDPETGILTDVVVDVLPAQRTAEFLAAKTLVPSIMGRHDLSQFVTFDDRRLPGAIDREKGMRKVVLYGSPDGSVSFGRVLASWQGVADGVERPLSAEIGGDREIFREMVDHFSFAVVGGLLFIFVALVLLYESIWMPFVILLSLPLAAVGGFLFLGIAGERLAMGSLIGLVLLFGLSAKNGILLVDAVAKQRKRYGLRLAVLYAVHTRVRPILMTSFALIVGMLPTVFLAGSGSEFRSPMALSIIGGVVSSTLLSFLFLPALFGLRLRLGKN